MVLYRYGNQSADFKTTGSVNSAAQHFNQIYAYSDDFSGAHPKVTYTVPGGEGGYFAVMVYTYSNSTKGITTVYKNRKP